MNKDQSLNNTIVQLIQKHGKKDAIVELLALTHSHSNKNLSIIQDTILYLLQNNHDWLNIIKLLKTWNKDQWGNQFLIRMKKRVNEQQNYENAKKIPLFEQISNLAEKYWKIISPKKQTFSYQNIIDQEIKIETNSIKHIPKITPKQQTNHKNSRDSTLFNIMKKFPKSSSSTGLITINNKQQNQNLIRDNKQSDKSNLQDEYPHLKYLQSRKKATLSPQKSLLDKKHIRVKYSNSKEKKKIYIKDQFSFSTIRQQQKQISFQQNENSKNFDSIQEQQIIQKELISNKKIQNNIKNKIDQKILDNLQNNNNFQFDWKQQITNKIINNKKNLQLYTDQQLSFIDFNIKSNNFYLDLYKKYKISAFQCLDQMLNQITI